MVFVQRTVFRKMTSFCQSEKVIVL